jgi:hypothetical protein
VIPKSCVISPAGKDESEAVAELKLDPNWCSSTPADLVIFFRPKHYLAADISSKANFVRLGLRLHNHKSDVISL